MNCNGDQYYEKITSIQQSMHKREKRRLELERELFAYCRSDKRISQIKCSKLHNYLREISDREERAKIRNLDLLREVESIETSMKKYQLNPGPLLQLKADVRRTVSKFMGTRERTNQEAESAKVEVMDCQSFMDTVNTPTALSVMGQQTQVCPPSSNSGHLLPCFPKNILPFPERLQSGLLNDSRTGREDNVTNQEYLSDDISTLNDSPSGYNFSEKHKKTAELPTFCALTVTVQNVPSKRKPSPPVTLTTSADETPSLCSNGTMGAEKPIREKEVTSQSPGLENEDRENSTPKRNSEMSLSSEENLSLSLTQSELDEDLSECAHELTEDNDSHFSYSPKPSLHAERFDSSNEGVIMESEAIPCAKSP